MKWYVCVRHVGADRRKLYIVEAPTKEAAGIKAMRCFVRGSVEWFSVVDYPF